MMENDPELVAEFVTESLESLADIEVQLLQIEEAGADIDDDLVNTVFRGVHSIKGVAGFLELSKIKSLSHHLEDVLNRIRNRNLTPTPAIVDVMLKASDELRSMIAESNTSNDVDISELLEALAAIHESKDGDDASSAARPAEDAGQVEELPTAEPQQTGGQTNAAPADESQTAEAESQVLTLEKPKKPPKAQQENKKPKPPAITTETNIRVSVSTLDHLMNLAGEMVLNRNRLLQYAATASESDLSLISSDIDHITCELQDAIMQTRMQPIGSVFSRFPRVVRDLSSKLGKQCEVDIEGKDVEVDKSIIEAIGDPLTHLVRNSVDHGVEDPATREAANKSPSGTIRLSAYHRAGQVCIDIEDNGGGIDPEKIKEKAVSKGVLTESQAAEMGKREALALIFHPGFSTAEKLTDVSGRGVGMDVVRTNIERIGGAVNVESEIGIGTTIRIVLPLTLAIIRSLIVGSQSRRFAIPQVNVSELVRVSKSDESTRIDRINDAVVFRLRGDLVPLVHMRDILNIDSKNTEPQVTSSTATSSTATNIVVVETGRARYGIVVDEMHDSEEIVVKPLGRDLKGCKSLAGATILGDGKVALILDVGGIADKADLNGDDQHGNECESIKERDCHEVQKLLTFRNANDDRFAIPMALVSRIERVAWSNIEMYGDSAVAQYQKAILPLVTVDNLDEAKAQSKHVSIIILESDHGEFGIIAPTIEEIRDIRLDIDCDAMQENGVVGLQIIDGVTTRILDVFQMLDLRNGEVGERSFNSEADSPKTILLAEDSKFFRTQVAKFLRESSYDVIEAEDGSIALNKLMEHASTVDIVITDVEMPNMNGLELCRSIRADPRLAHLPLLALTSLADKESMQRGHDSGVNEYHVKLERKSLLEGIQRLTKQEKKLKAGV